MEEHTFTPTGSCAHKYHSDITFQFPGPPMSLLERAAIRCKKDDPNCQCSDCYVKARDAAWLAKLLELYGPRPDKREQATPYHRLRTGEVSELV